MRNCGVGYCEKLILCIYFFIEHSFGDIRQRHHCSLWISEFVYFCHHLEKLASNEHALCYFPASVATVVSVASQDFKAWFFKLFWFELQEIKKRKDIRFIIWSYWLVDLLTWLKICNLLLPLLLCDVLLKHLCVENLVLCLVEFLEQSVRNFLFWIWSIAKQKQECFLETAFLCLDLLFNCVNTEGLGSFDPVDDCTCKIFIEIHNKKLCEWLIDLINWIFL